MGDRVREREARGERELGVVRMSELVRERERERFKCCGTQNG